MVRGHGSRNSVKDRVFGARLAYHRPYPTRCQEVIPIYRESVWRCPRPDPAAAAPAQAQENPPLSSSLAKRSAAGAGPAGAWFRRPRAAPYCRRRARKSFGYPGNRTGAAGLGGAGGAPTPWLQRKASVDAVPETSGAALDYLPLVPAGMYDDVPTGSVTRRPPPAPTATEKMPHGAFP
jgi:hypothetical protein